MVQAFDHRAANVIVNPENLNRPAQPEPTTDSDHADAEFVPLPQFWVREKFVEWPNGVEWSLAFKDVTSPTNVRTMIAVIVPKAGVGNTLPLITQQKGHGHYYASWAPLLLANLNSIPFDYVARQKVQGQHLNWFIVEQLPVVPQEHYRRRFKTKTAAEIVKEEVLRLTYTANDMAPFANDIGYNGPVFPWDPKDRLNRRAKLDALYFMLMFASETPEDVEMLRQLATYIFSTFPILEREDTAVYGRYLSRDLCLAYINALAADDPDAKIILS
ncbi:MAG TPA: hypothetical protein VKN18_17585 [Blastocatellia bacterium]|nr:hypothetical protein [Blastocatellia bacterium]